VGRKLARRRQCSCVPHAQTDQRERRRRDDRAERRSAEDRHRNLPPRRPIAAQHRGAAGLLQPCCRNTLACGLHDKAQSAKTTHPDLKRSRRISWPERLKKSLRNSELRSPRPQAPSPTTSLSSASALSGQICLDASGKLVAKGKLGNGVSLEDGQKAARA